MGSKGPATSDFIFLSSVSSQQIWEEGTEISYMHAAPHMHNLRQHQYSLWTYIDIS